MSYRAWLAMMVLGVSPQLAIGLDAFDRHALPQLREAAEGAEGVAELTSRQAADLKLLGPRINGPCIVVQTDAGNWAKAILNWGLRKTGEQRVPVLLIERFVTYDVSRPGTTTAAGKDVMLFAGFRFDFDIGQVVPEGQGEEIEFTTERSIRVAGAGKVFPLDGPVVADAEAAPDPNDHEGVLPRDFSGEWRIDADGRWRGVLELTVDDAGNMGGQFVSDETQSAYEIIGRVDSGAHRAVFEVQLANAPQLFEAFLWTKDKSIMAGTSTLSERKFGFYAVREPAAEE